MSSDPSGRGHDPDPQVAALRLAQERELAMERIARMESDMDSLIAASLDSNADDEHDPEGATIAYERSQLAALSLQVRQHLAEIDEAGNRLQAGTYWSCEVCSEPIGAGRLEARPSTRTCVRHATAAVR
jgi:RNA polymerase-binding transcription factor DksA